MPSTSISSHYCMVTRGPTNAQYAFLQPHVLTSTCCSSYHPCLTRHTRHHIAHLSLISSITLIDHQWSNLEKYWWQHDGFAAAMYSKENLLNNVLSAIPPELGRDEWIAALSRTVIAWFVKIDVDFQEEAWASGTTAAFVIIEGEAITVTSVGDSCCVLESAEGDIYPLSVDHRPECDDEERGRIATSRGEVGQLNTGTGVETVPLRCWLGGLHLSQSIGDMDVGEFIVPILHVKQVKLSTTGDAAASRVVKEAYM